MTALTRTPENTNFLQTNKYSVEFARIPNVTYFCQNANIPGLSIGEAIQPTPFIDLSCPGEKLTYDSFNIGFAVDEDLKSWLEIHDWMRAMTFPYSYEEYKNLSRLSRNTKKGSPQYSDATMYIRTSKLNVNYKITLHDCFPIALSSILFSSTDSPESILTSDATFRFSLFDIEKV